MGKGTITFWDKNDGHGNQVGETLDGETSYSIDCRSREHSFVSNRIRSIKLKNVPALTSITLFDKHDGRRDYNYVTVTVNEDLTEKDGDVVINTLNERNYYGNYKVEVAPGYTEFNADLGYTIGAYSMDGKASRINIGYVKPMSKEEIEELREMGIPI